MPLIGNKNNIDLYKNLLGNLIPNDIFLYVEPFGGEFGLYEIMSIKPKAAVYNDINVDLYAIINSKYKKSLKVFCFNEDYKNIIQYFDDEYTFFYLDPPYLNREYLYKNHTFLNEENHIELSDILKNIKGKFLLSYQDRPLMRELYKGNNFILKPEIAITNY